MSASPMVRCVLFLNYNSFTPSHPHLSPDTQKMSRNLMTFPLEPGWLHWLSYDSRILVEGFLNVLLFYITQHVWEYVQFDILETISADLRVCVSKKQMQMSTEYVVWFPQPTQHLNELLRLIQQAYQMFESLIELTFGMSLKTLIQTFASQTSSQCWTCSCKYPWLRTDYWLTD